MLRCNSRFMEFPDVPRLLTKAQALGLEDKPMETSYFLSRLRILPTSAPNIYMASSCQ